MTTLRKSIQVVAIVMIGLLCCLIVEAQQKGHVSEPGKQLPDLESHRIEDLILNGEWQKVYNLAERKLQVNPRGATTLFIRFLSRQLSYVEEKSGEGMTSYDYPFTNASASAQLKLWIANLERDNPKNINVLYMVATHQLLAEQNSRLATLTFEKILAAEPDQVVALAAVGATYGTANRLEDATKASEKAITINAEYAPAYNNLGMVAMSRNDYAQAEKYFKKATSLKTAGAMEWFNLGSLYYFQRNMRDSKFALERSLNISPNLIEARYNLAAVCYNLGDKSASIKHLKHLLDVAPDSPYSSKARQNLRQLGEPGY